MSALLPPSDARLARRDDDGEVSERERALQLELRTLRAENEYLRQRYAQQVSVTPLHGQNALELRCCSAVPIALEALQQRVRRMFDLDAEPQLHLPQVLVERPGQVGQPLVVLGLQDEIAMYVVFGHFVFSH